LAVAVDKEACRCRLVGHRSAEIGSSGVQLAQRRARDGAQIEIPEILRRSLTWDQGKEMALHTKITEATGLPTYFCDPHSPWQLLSLL
jgi:IS30 family transposase